MAKPARTAPRPLLRVTEIPGVYLNRDGAQVDASGVLLSIGQTLSAERALRAELGDVDETPAQYLRRVALDPRQPQAIRMQAAIASAPYFDRKQPMAIEGGAADRPIRTEAQSAMLARLQAMDPEARRAALAVLESLGVLN